MDVPVSKDRVYDDYFRDVNRTQIPSSALAEQILFYRYHELGDPRARDTLIRSNLRFVIKTARQFYRGDSEFLKTLIAAGNLGLLTAVERYCQWVIRCPACSVQNYVKRTHRQRCKTCKRQLRKKDASRFSTRFLTYAHWWIVEAMRTEMYNASLIHIPPYKQKEYNRRRREGEVVGPTYVQYDETETDEPSRDQYVVAKHLASVANTERHLIDDHAVSLLHSVLSALNPRQAYVLIAYYGLREEQKNLREIAATLGICSERVRQIKEGGINVVRRELHKRKIRSVIDVYN